MQKKVNAQYRRLKEKNAGAFVWLDEPGLGWVFSGLSGYGDVQAKREYAEFVAGLEGVKSLHLCANVNLPYLLSMGIDLLSFDAFQIEVMPKGYAGAVAGFLGRGGVIAWGIVPTDSTTLAQQTPASLFELLTGYWDAVTKNSDIAVEQIAAQALIAPARCCLKNIGRVGAAGEDAACDPGRPLTSEERVVETAFGYLKELSAMLKDRFGLRA
jgi:hypothetical protein